jgi:hypothetical protein
MSEGKIRSLANLMKSRKESGEKPYILLLGSGASTESGAPSFQDIVERVVEDHGGEGAASLSADEQLEKFYELWQGFSEAERYNILNRPFRDLTPSEGYRYLAGLVNRGYFDVILSTNCDTLLEDALNESGLRSSQFQVMVNGVDKEEQIRRQMEFPTPRVKLIKLHGDLNSRNFAFAPEEIWEFHREIHAVVEGLLSRDVLLVGHNMQDNDINQAIRAEGGAIWYIRSEELRASEPIWGMMSARKCKDNAISGDYGSFGRFFQRLYRGVTGEDMPHPATETAEPAAGAAPEDEEVERAQELYQWAIGERAALEADRETRAKKALEADRETRVLKKALKVDREASAEKERLTESLDRAIDEYIQLMMDIGEKQAKGLPVTDALDKAQHLKGTLDRIRTSLKQEKLAEAQKELREVRFLSKPPIDDVTTRLRRHPVKRFDRRTLDKIQYLVIQHSVLAGSFPPEKIADYLVEERQWPGIGYHFYITSDGKIYQTNHLETVCYFAGDNVQDNPLGMCICFAGNFTDEVPTASQLSSGGKLLAFLMQELNLTIDSIKGQKDFVATQSPGKQWDSGRKWKDMLLQKIRTLQTEPNPMSTKKSIRHYMLFGQYRDVFSVDWEAAKNYVYRFRPVCGFSVDDAMSAEYVTIVGSPAGVSTEEEQMLRDAGCEVERIAGMDLSATKHLLDGMAERGERFVILQK